MAEDNSATELDDEEADSSADNSVADAEQEEPVAAETEASGDDTPAEEEPAQDADGSADAQVAEPPSESANEPTIGSEVPVMEPPVVSSGPSDQPIADISMILDIPVTLSMEIGQTRISISELLKLGKDSVIELQRMADEPMDVLVNGTLVAHGEAVVVGDRFGIRLTDVISPQERLRKFT